MKFSKKHIFIALHLFLVFTGIKSSAQLDPLYSQYMFNIQSYNPAYAGSWERFGATAMARQQWIGFKGAPQSVSLTVQSLLKQDKMGVGFSVENDNIGKTNLLSLFADYSYRVDLNENLALRLGLKAGFSNFRNNFTDYVFWDMDDPNLSEDNYNRYLVNFGVGAFLYSDIYYLGISIPRLLQNNLDSYSRSFDFGHFTGTGGYVFELNDIFKLKPSFIFRYVKNMASILDINASVLIYDKLWLGIMLRTSDLSGFGINTNYLIGDKLRIGYAYDFMNNSDLNAINLGTHEVIITYELKLERSKFASPRYF